MSHKIFFFPIGNADTTLIQLENNQVVLFDYAHMKCEEDKEDKRIDLPKELNKIINTDYDIVCFTHADNDHLCGFSNYFYLEHAAIYQNTERKKIKELWVPAAVLIEKNLVDDALILRTEARYRLKNKKGIRIFSRPKALKDWCDQQEDICYEDICHLIVDAGTLAPNFTKANNGVEFFVHSPFVSETQNIDRNNEAIIVQATFNDRCETKVILGSDSDSAAWSDIVNVTKHFKNEEKLEWDIFHISHHCSYKSLNCSEKGKTETVPSEQVMWLFETQGHDKSRIISPSWEIPNEDSDQPPHRQAANYYKRISNLKNGEFKVTMETPSKDKPDTIVFEIDKNDCAKIKLKETATASFAYTNKTSRAGLNE